MELFKCSKCKEFKSKDLFSKQSSNSRGFRYDCKSCCNNWSRKYYKENPDKYVERNRYELTEKGIKNRRKANAKWLRNNKDKKRTHSQVAQELKMGRMVKQDCFCGSDKSEAHHEDYSKPLEVVWLCRKHHSQRHKELNRM
tara:strand:+ start:130 stop:552 length:423 start_codon:yes stop_codon:yes gene_type:complete